MSGRWTEGFDQLRTLPVEASARAVIGETEALAARYLAGRAPLFEQRIADGRIRDGHGDLQADDIFVLDDGPRILDCIEFGEEYRWGDVLSDVAFLAMDLERLGRPDLGQRFLQLHRELSADRWPSTLAHHYVAYRAHIRAKVGIVRSAQQGEPAGPGVSRYLDLSRAHLRDAQVQIVVVGGAPGTGKSTVAAALGDRLGAVVLRTDEVRQRVPVGEGHGPVRAGSRDGHVPGDAARGPPPRRPRGARDPRCHLELGRAPRARPACRRQTPRAT